MRIYSFFLFGICTFLFYSTMRPARSAGRIVRRTSRLSVAKTALSGAPARRTKPLGICRPDREEETSVLYN